jgi:hypothetical protein
MRNRPASTVPGTNRPRWDEAVPLRGVDETGEG